MANSFSLDVAKFAENFEGGAEQAVRGTFIKFSSSVVKGWPTDEGRSRGNWFATGQKPSTKYNPDTKDLDGSKTIANIIGTTNSIQDWSRFTLTNNSPYSEVIEFGGYPKPVKKGTYNKATKSYEIRSVRGYSKQAPAGVLRVNIKRFNTLLEQEAKKALPK